MKRLIASGVALGLIAALTVVASTNAAAGASAPVTGGKVVLKFDQATGEGFADMSIGIQTTGAGKDGKRGFSWPIRRGAGELRPGPRGSVLSGGGPAFFTEGGPGVKFRKFGTRFGSKKTQLYAKSAGSGGRFLNLDLGKATVSESASGLKVKDAPATLTKAGAKVLSDTFDFPFRKGIPMGTVTMKVATG